MTTIDCTTWVYADKNPDGSGGRAYTYEQGRATAILAQGYAGEFRDHLGNAWSAQGIIDAVHAGVKPYMTEMGADGIPRKYQFAWHTDHLGVEALYCGDPAAHETQPPPVELSSVEGVDVSSGEHVFSELKASGRVFAFMKASEGVKGSFREPPFVENWKGAKAAGLLRGSYHFFHPSLDPHAQAKYHFARVQEACAAAGEQYTALTDYLGPVLDLEVSPEPPADLGRAEWEDKDKNAMSILACVRRSAELFGRRPIIYTSPGEWAAFVSDGDAAQIAAESDLWLAYWVRAGYLAAADARTLADKFAYGTAKGWKNPIFWQYAQGEASSVPGIAGAVDLCRFVGGSADDLIAYASTQGKAALPGQANDPPPPPGGGGGNAVPFQLAPIDPPGAGGVPALEDDDDKDLAVWQRVPSLPGGSLVHAATEWIGSISVNSISEGQMVPGPDGHWYTKMGGQIYKKVG